MSNDDLLQSLLIQQAAAKARYETLTDIIKQLRYSETAPIGETLGEMIKARRIELGLSQEQLGLQAGYGAGAGISIHRIENKGVVPKDGKLGRICEILNIDSDALPAKIEESEETSTDTTDQ